MSQVTTDEDIMEELIKCPWDNLDELASRVGEGGSVYRRQLPYDHPQ